MNFASVLKNRYFQLVAVSAISLVVGYQLFPSKELTEEVESRTKKDLQEQFETKIKEVKQSHKEEIESISSREKSLKTEVESLKSRVNILVTENRKLSESSKRSRFKIVKPDGTIVEREFEESKKEEITSVVTEIREEFDRKVSSIETKWSQIHKDRLTRVVEKHSKQIDELKKSHLKEIEEIKSLKEVKINPKKLGLDILINNKLHYGLGFKYNLMGPFYVRSSYLLSNNEALESVTLGLGISF